MLSHAEVHDAVGRVETTSPQSGTDGTRLETHRLQNRKQSKFMWSWRRSIPKWGRFVSKMGTERPRAVAIDALMHHGNSRHVVLLNNATRIGLVRQGLDKCTITALRR